MADIFSVETRFREIPGRTTCSRVERQLRTVNPPLNMDANIIEAREGTQIALMESETSRLFRERRHERLVAKKMLLARRKKLAESYATIGMAKDNSCLTSCDLAVMGVVGRSVQ